MPGSVNRYSDNGPVASPLGPQGGDNNSGFVAILRTIKRRQGLFLFTFVVVTGFLSVNTLRQRIFSPVYQGGFQMQISNPFEGRSNLGATGTVEALARSKFENDVPSLVVLLRSPMLLKPLADKQGVPMGAVSGGLSITQDGGVNNILNVGLRWGDPAKGRAILTQLSQEYIKFSQTQRQAALESGIRYLDKQSPDILRRVNLLQGELRRFRERNVILEPGTTAGSIQGERDGLVTQLRALQRDQVQLESQLASIKAGRLRWTPSGAPTAEQQMGRFSLATPGRAGGSAPGPNSTTTTQTAQLVQFEQDLAAARATYREDSPIVQSIKAKRDQLLPVVQRQASDGLKAALLTNSAQQDEINRQILLLNENFRTSPRKLQEYEELQQRLGVVRDSYASYIRARETFRLELARSVTPWQIISPAEFGDLPVEPDVQRNLLRALVLGLLAGVGVAMLRERTDHVFHTPMEAERELQLPVLGLIPYLPLEPGIEISTSISKMSASERFAIKESLRSLFTTFRLLRADRSIRLVGLTSSTQGEGKSTAVTIFARTLADLGMKVLVVDADMRLPMQGRYLGIDQGEGFSTLLSDSSQTSKDLILNLQENLDVLPAGPKPPDPAKLLNSMRCQEVINELRDMPDYDIILFDAPPCLMLADPILLGEKLDGILFLVGLGKVSKDLAPQASRRIRATGVDVLGLICNQVNFPSRLNDYGYEYGYYYHYAYATGYSKASGRYGRYGQGIKGYLKRYRDSYVTSRYRDSYTASRYLSDRYIREGAAVKNYHDAAVKNYHDAGVQAANGDNKTNGNGANGAAGRSNGAGGGSEARRGGSSAGSSPSGSNRNQGVQGFLEAPIRWIRRRFNRRR
jgi:capsular exopolysaccharide synthesis family protein